MNKSTLAYWSPMRRAKKCKKMHIDKAIAREQVRSAENVIFEKQIFQINKHVENCINKCSKLEAGKKFYEAEKEIIKLVYHFGTLLLQLYLVSAQRSMNYESRLNAGAYYLNTRLKYRTLKTFFGKVTYGRYYMEHKKGGGGFFPLDKGLGLSRDGFSPVVIKLVTNLSTRMSFNTAHELFKRFCHWSPSTEAIQRLVLGLGREAHDYMEEPHGRYEGDEEILVIEGAVRYVIGERMDCSGMRWIPQRAEALLHLRCIELNGEWEQFFDWSYRRWAESLAKGGNIIVRTNEGIDLGEKYADAA